MDLEARQGFLDATDLPGASLHEPAVGDGRRIWPVLLHGGAPSPSSRRCPTGRRARDGRRPHRRDLGWELPPRILRAVQALLEEHRDAALRAFNETLEHRFPGTLEEGRETTDD